MPEIKKTGAKLVAVSPMLAKYTPQLVNKLSLTFPILSDPGNKAMETLGIVHRLPDELIEVYQGFGIDLERYNGDTEWRLPLPGRIIVDTNGVVRNVSLTTDHTQRPEPTETLELLRAR
jgi:peroxiredoxin